MKKLILLLLGLIRHIKLIADYSYDVDGNIASIYIPENGGLYQYDSLSQFVC